MRNLVLLWVGMLLVLPLAAQDSEPEASQTIGAVVADAAAADEAQFTLLQQALADADPVLLALLSAADESLTVFAPTDAAFTAALETLDLTYDELAADSTLLNAVLRYHVIPAALDREYFRQTIGPMFIPEPNAYSGTLLTNGMLKIEIPAPDDTETVLTINDTVTATEAIDAANGIIYVIDSVILPDFDSIALETDPGTGSTLSETLSGAAQDENAPFNTLQSALQAGDASLLALVESDQPVTIFAPTDTGFLETLRSVGLNADAFLSTPDLVTDVLRYHIMPGRLTLDMLAANAAGEPLLLLTLFPRALQAETVDGELRVNGVPVINEIRTANGVILVIDGAFLPPR